ncbi:MAG: adenylate kinase [Terriglobia bacterium]
MGAALHPEKRVRVLPSARAVLMLGPPGAGKGTQSRAVSCEFGIPEISTGEMLRGAVRERTQLGQQVKTLMEAGALVPDAVVCQLVQERTAWLDCKPGFILDGFPRNLEQAGFLDRLLEAQGRGGARVINIRADPGALIRRLVGREVCPVCGSIYNVYSRPPQKPGICDLEGARLVRRKDDREDAIRMRLAEYESQTKPLIDHYRGLSLLREVDGNRKPTVVTEAIFRLLDE